jgi:hypothetical protein
MSNLTDALKPRYPEDVARLKEEIPLLRRFSHMEVALLYRKFSDTRAASWLILDDGLIQEFAAWLEE